MKTIIRTFGKILFTELKMPLVGIPVILLLAGVGVGMLAREKPGILGIKTAQGDNEALRKEAETLISEVGKLITLPQDEKPTIATVTDIEKVKDQAFFRNSQNGDRVLIYTNAKKAILYRPSEKRIVDVGTVTVNDKGQTQPSSGGGIEDTRFRSLKFTLFNGTKTTGLTSIYGKEIIKIYPDAEIVEKTNASVATYEKTILVDLSGQKKDVAEKVAKDLGIEVTDLPTGEVKPSTGDFLIIIGADKVANSEPKQ